MVAWHINAVRVRSTRTAGSGSTACRNDTAANYQTAIAEWVSLLNQNGMVVILDLHWAAPGARLGTSIGRSP